MPKMICYDLVELHVIAEIDFDVSELEQELLELCSENHASVMPTRNRIVWLVRGNCNTFAAVVGDNIDYIRALLEASESLILNAVEVDMIYQEFISRGSWHLVSEFVAKDTPITGRLKYALYAYISELQNKEEFKPIIIRMLTPALTV